MSENTNSIPEEFIKVIRDFIGDLKTTFPEYVPFIDKWWKGKEHFNYIDEEEDRINAYEKSEKKSVKLLFDFCKKKLPPRFFSINSGTSLPRSPISATTFMGALEPRTIIPISVDFPTPECPINKLIFPSIFLRSKST